MLAELPKALNIMKYPILNPNPQTFHQNIYQNTKDSRNHKNPR